MTRRQVTILIIGILVALIISVGTSVFTGDSLNPEASGKSQSTSYLKLKNISIPNLSQLLKK